MFFLATSNRINKILKHKYILKLRMRFYIQNYKFLLLQFSSQKTSTCKNVRKKSDNNKIKLQLH